MTKRQLNIRIAKKEKEWEEENKKAVKFFSRAWFIIKREWKLVINSMMYNKKPTDKTEKLLEQIKWWLKMVGIFFMFKGITYWLTGR